MEDEIESKKQLAISKSQDAKEKSRVKLERLQTDIENLEIEEDAINSQLDDTLDKIIHTTEKSIGDSLIQQLETLQIKESKIKENLNAKHLELRELKKNLRDQILEIQKQLWDNLQHDGSLQEVRNDLLGTIKEISIHRRFLRDESSKQLLYAHLLGPYEIEEAKNKASNETITDGSIEEITKWEIDFQELQIFPKKLGGGSYGVVYQGKYQQTDVAIKKLHVQELDEEGFRHFVKEVQIMTSLKHQNILLFMGACTQPDKMCVVTELMSNGSVEKFLYGKDQKLSFRRKFQIVKGVAQGMNWLHNLKNPSPILHLDLKPANLLLDDNFNVRISDFGMSVLKSQSKGYRGSPSYMAPEMLNNQEYDSKADIYSFGITLWEIYMEKTPYKDKFHSIDELKDAVIRGTRPDPLKPEDPPLLKRLIESCLNPSPQQRPSFKQMLVDRVFDKIIVEGLLKKPNDEAAKFWVLAFEYKWVIPWSEFVDGLNKTWKANILDEKRLSCLKLLLNINQNAQLVSIENFANVMDWFGPVSDGNDLLEKIWKLSSHPWFWGSLDTKQAENQLIQSNEGGAFLIRFSNTSPGSFTLSALNQKKSKIIHTKIKHQPGTKYRFEKCDFDSLEDLVNKGHTLKDVYFKPKASCEGSPLYAITFQSKHKVNQVIYSTN